MDIDKKYISFIVAIIILSFGSNLICDNIALILFVKTLTMIMSIVLMATLYSRHLMEYNKATDLMLIVAAIVGLSAITKVLI